MNKITVMLLLILAVSCSDKNETESIFITNKNEYWQYDNYCNNTCCIYFQFHENGSHDKYLRSYVGFDLFNNDGDLESGPRTWSIKTDSIFVWDKEEYKIEKISNKEILLSYYHYKINGKKCYVRLSKWVKTPQGPKPVDKLDSD